MTGRGELVETEKRDATASDASLEWVADVIFCKSQAGRAMKGGDPMSIALANGRLSAFLGIL